MKALFKLEVPEIQQGIVEIRAAAREVGSRTKIAVFSRDDSIDPVGACVGLKGSRVQAVVNELGGERIDIVPWSPDPERFAKLALAPAKVARCSAIPSAKTIQAVVDEDQLSLAIGRNGQNVRLASELTGWKIDLYSSREWLERGGESPLFAPLPPEEETAGPDSAQRARGPVARATAAARERGLPDAQRHHRPRARGHRQDPGHDARSRPSSCSPSRRAHRRRRRREVAGRAPMSRLLGLLGLGYRGRRVVVGVDAVRKELQAGKSWCVVVAEDASPRAVDKVVRLASAKGVPMVRARAPPRSARSWESRR